MTTSTGARLTLSGYWTDVSDRNMKENFANINTRQVLETLASLPIQQWNYKVEEDGIRHIGPMAQDFYAAFGYGDSDTGLASIDTNGVALAAIQGLYEVVQEKDAQIAELETRLAEVESQVGGGAAPALAASWLPMIFGVLGVAVGAFITRRSQKGAVK